MTLDQWVKITFAGPLLLLRVAEMSVNSYLVIAHRSQRFVKATGHLNSRDKREAALMVREKFVGGAEAVTAAVRFLATSLRNESRRNSSFLNYSTSSLRSLWASRNGFERIIRGSLIVGKLSLLLLKQPLRIWLFCIDYMRNVSAPLQRQVISNADRLSHEK